jgi:hypothetical protein
MICIRCHEQEATENKAYGGKRFWCANCISKHNAERPVKQIDLLNVAALRAFKKQHSDFDRKGGTIIWGDAARLLISNGEIQNGRKINNRKIVEAYLDRVSPGWRPLDIIDVIPSAKLTAEQEAVGIALGILDESDFEGSIANEGEDESFFEKYSRTRKAADEFPNWTKTELVLGAIRQEQRCWVHGGSLQGYYQRGNRPICRNRVVQAHYPSKAAAKEAGMILTKDHIHAACWVCNDLMTDAFGVSTPEDEMRQAVLQKAAIRKIEFLEPQQVKTEKRLVEQVIFARA